MPIDYKSHLAVCSFNGNPNLGVFCRANDNVAFIRKGLLKKIKKKIKEVLEVNLVELSIVDANIIGSLLTFNSNGVVATDFIDNDAIRVIKDNGLDVCIIDDKLNAVGNNILVNDKGALIHPSIENISLEKIEKTLGVPVRRGTIGTLKTVGMLAVVTNKGLLCHPKVSEEEKSVLEKVFEVNVMIGTVNHGSSIIGSGLVANSNGVIIGNLTTGIEMGRIEEALGFLE
jgi:translation initiation factor 6